MSVGRPRKPMAKKHCKQMHLFLTPAEHRMARKMGEAQGLAGTDVVRLALRAAWKRFVRRKSL